jgi:hypothetical protein
MACQEEKKKKSKVFTAVNKLTAVPGVRACFGGPCGEGVVFDRSATRILILKNT